MNDPEAFLRDLFSRAVAAAQPEDAIAGVLATFERRAYGRILVLGAGKAAASMAKAVEDHWPAGMGRAKPQGLVIVPDGYARPCRSIEVVEASHPVPDERGLAAAQRILALAGEAGADDLVLALISGGASALMAVPAPGITLADKRAVTAALLRSGASIAEFNCVRKHLSAIKGGRLAQAAAPARVFTLVVSDVVGDDPAVIASGPTVPDPTTCADALAILKRYGIAVAPRIAAMLADGELETPKRLPGTEPPRLIVRPADALAAAAAVAVSRGLAVHNLGDGVVGEARGQAEAQAALVREIVAGCGPVRPPCLVLSGGELVVTVRGEGRGGPNTEFALAFALACEDLANVWLLAADTDGNDGAAHAAGALVRPGLLAAARLAGIDPVGALQNNDSAGFFAGRGTLVTPGPTFTNVNDFRAALVLRGERT